MRRILLLLVLHLLLVVSCAPRPVPVMIGDGMSRRAVAPDSARGIPGYIEFLDSWCNGRRVVPEPFVRRASAPALPSDQGAIELRGILDDGETGEHVLEWAQIRLSSDSLLSDTSAVGRVIERGGAPLLAPEGAYWLSIRRIGLLPTLVRVHVRAGMIRTVIVPVAMQRMC